MEGCIFCMIGTGELVSRKVYEDEWVVAFDDIAPQAPVHTLIVPKAHYSSMIDDVPADLICALFGAVAEVARIKGVDKTGYRLIVNNGHRRQADRRSTFTCTSWADAPCPTAWCASRTSEAPFMAPGVAIVTDSTSDLPRRSRGGARDRRGAALRAPSATNVSRMGTSRRTSSFARLDAAAPGAERPPRRRSACSPRPMRRRWRRRDSVLSIHISSTSFPGRSSRRVRPPSGSPAGARLRLAEPVHGSRPPGAELRRARPRPEPTWKPCSALTASARAESR